MENNRISFFTSSVPLFFFFFPQSTKISLFHQAAELPLHFWVRLPARSFSEGPANSIYPMMHNASDPCWPLYSAVSSSALILRRAG